MNMHVQVGWRVRAAKQGVLAAIESIENADGEDVEAIVSEMHLALLHLRKAEAAAIVLAKALIERRGEDRREQDRAP